MLPFIKLIPYLQSCCSFNQNSCDVQHLIRLLLPPSLFLSISLCLSVFPPLVLWLTGQHPPHCMLEFIKRITNAKATWQQLCPQLTHFPPICLFGACLAIISNHILTFMPSKNRGNFSFVRHFLKRRHFTNFIKPNVIKMPQTTAWRQ